MTQTKKVAKNFTFKSKFNAKYNYILILVNKDGSICAFNKSETYDNCYKQLLFWESNYAYQREVEKWVIDELVYA
jgi:hypothetical protein